MRPFFVAVVIVLSYACAARSRPAVPSTAELLTAAASVLADADALLLHGCYSCLLEARDEYARLAGGPLRDDALTRLFEAEILITLREKELALPFDASLERARVAGGNLPAAFQASRILAIVEAVPIEQEGASRLRAREFLRAHRVSASSLDDELSWLGTTALRAPVREYVALAARCTGAAAAPRGLSEGPVDDPVLLLYRRNTCSGVWRVPIVEGLREADPPYTEAPYFLGRALAMRLRTYADRLRFRSYITEAALTFPRSPAVTYLAGSGSQLLGSCADALPFYEQTIALESAHENAWLGRTMCLSVLGRPLEGIEAATTLIALESDNQRDAYYWRAFNRHRLKDVTLARADIEESKRRGSTPEILTLAGIIEHDQDDLGIAAEDLSAALGMSPRACTAAWYLGLVHIRRLAWSDAAKGFESAMNCYLANARDAEQGLAALDATEGLDPGYRQQQADNFRLAIADDRRQQRAAAMNAANCFVNAREMAAVDALLLTASEDTSLAQVIAELRAHIKEHGLDETPGVSLPAPRAALP